MAGHGERLSRKREQAIAALLALPSVRAAAEQVGVSERQLRRWMKEPTFAAALHEARQQLLQRAVDGLLGAATEAIQTLRANLSSTNANASNTAARTILEQMLRGFEVVHLSERVAALEGDGQPGIGDTEDAR